MDLKKLGDVPKSYVKEILNSLSKLDKLKKVPFFTGIHFKDTEDDLNKKIDDYRKVDRESRRIWKIVELSRDDGRPQYQDYIKGIFTDFISLSGDRLSMEDQSIMAGLGKIGGRTVAIIGHNKGKDIKERVKYNFGSSIPQGYRKSQRIMKLADRFGFPIITFVDTPGAYAGIDAEDSGQSSAIAHSIQLMFELKVPVIVVLIGEGGSGGALALAVGNEIAMLENSTYSVISPEACSAILWKNPSGTRLAARALKLTSKDLLRLGIIDRIINEPIGGAQNDPKRMVRIVKRYISDAVGRLCKYSGEELVLKRAEKFENMGSFIRE
ncbi:MAG: acetyl-CoA carboxylase carboxyltransferase subunit alpha [Actinobacteria bacterium]|nr:acetyl-CoA carboxylase carboxyltransferase subunit alpha [Actinomycetota bacterium]